MCYYLEYQWSCLIETGETVEKRLDNARNNFERGKTDVFPLEVPNLGALKRAVIRHDNSGPSPAWYCCSVSIVRDTAHYYVYYTNTMNLNYILYLTAIKL